MLNAFKRYSPWQTARGLPILLSLPLGLLAAGLARYAILLPVFYDEFLNSQTLFFRVEMLNEGTQGLVSTLALAAGIGAALFLAGGILGLLRKPWALRFLRACFTATYILLGVYGYAVIRVTSLIFQKNLQVDGIIPDAIVIFIWRYHFIWPAAALALAIALLQVVSWRRAAIEVYCGYHEETPAAGDRIIENLRTHGADPWFRKSLIGSLLAHFMVIVLIPCLLGRGCVQDYRVPLGSGNPVISIVKIVKPKKKPQKKYVLNPKSAISFHVPDLDESDLSEKVEEDTQLTYEADPSSVHQLGKLGVGGGKQGGWPDGMKNAVVRFIRLEYDGENWNDGMDPVSRADMNFLDEFNRVTGFKTAKNGESHPIRLLDDYHKGFAPPFVYMTGSGQINVSARDLEILRKYLMDGGMLFADCGSPQWDRSFRAFAQTLFPGEPLLVIADDDPIYLMPYMFPNGAPPLWHHGGSRALGIKRGRRWVVYYHPGDINDAWKTGHSGMSPFLSKRAYQLGVNIVYHAFTHYLEATRKYRK